MTRKTVLLITIGVFTISFLIGLGISTIIFPGLYFLFICIVIIFALTIITAIVDLKRKTKYYKIPGLFLICLTLGAIDSLLIQEIHEYRVQKVSDKILSVIEKYKLSNRQYPLNLYEVGEQNADINYLTDSTRQQFQLYFTTYGVFTKKYDSKTKQWSSHTDL